MSIQHQTPDSDYQKQARYLRRCDILSFIVTICFALLLYAFLIYVFDPTFSSPWTLGLMGVITGIGTLLLIVFLMRGYLPAFSGTLHVECDPNQFLILYRAFLRKPYPLPVVYTLGHFYLGEFDRAAMYAEEAMHKKGMYRFSMHCFKAYSEYMQGLFPAVDHTIRNFESILEHSKPAVQQQYKNSLQLLHLIQAMMDLDIEKVNQYRAYDFFSTLSKSKITEGWLHYLLGTAAFQVQDYESASQHFSFLMQGFEKTFLAAAAAESMEKINSLLPDSESK